MQHLINLEKMDTFSNTKYSYTLNIQYFKGTPFATTSSLSYAIILTIDLSPSQLLYDL